MKIVVYWDKEDMKELIYNILLLKNLKKEIYVFLNGIDKIEKIRKIKEKYNVVFIVSKAKISKYRAIKILKEKLSDDILFLEGRINFSIKDLKEGFNKDFVRFGYKSKILSLFRLNGINRVFFFRKDLDMEELIYNIQNRIKSDIDIEYFLDKYVLSDIINNLKKVIRRSINFLKYILRKKIIKDFINQKIGIFSLKIFTFFLTIFLSRFFSPDFYGRYVNFHNLTLAIYSFTSLLIPDIAFKFFSKNPEKLSEYLTSFLIIYISLSIVSFLILFFLKDIIQSIFFTRNIALIFLLTLTSFFISVRYTIPSIFISNLDFKTVKYFDLLEGLLKFILVIFLSIFFYSRGSLVGLFLSFFVLSIIETALLIKKYPNSLNFKFNKEITKEVIKNAVSVNYINLFNSFYSQVRFNIISLLLGAGILALYYNAINVVYIVMSFVSIYPIMFPRIARWEINRIKRDANYILILQLLINLPISLLMFIFSRDILVLLFGEAYSSSSNLLKLSTSLLIISPLSLYYNILWINSRLKEISIINLFSLVSLIILDLVLISKYSAIGAVISIIFFEFVRNALSYIFYRAIYSNDN
ncbi:MAG: hypothetical protein BXU00_02240 [Candidatus Nanoclepta minutus]|uniref:Polysaccharide biosynthesis protein C-terminal domain-containing protein n=1 Tax=Candidatus Nanoclepta minutus TaxID=1940235 RepID=A0A397WRP0_9ARCH|nr:MAG: hypothetical protein BXU00_02240 [Candidatus Nanoclepta minutus]